MQHLKPVGVQEDGFDSVLIEAPAQKLKGKGVKSKDPIQLVELPPEALPTISELPISYEAQEAIPSSIAGFQPDMNPHLRQTLEALEDDAFVDEDLNDDFFGELVAGGERVISEDVNFEFREWGEGVEHVDEEPDVSRIEGIWEAAFNKFKSTRKTDSTAGDSDLDSTLEDGDTVGSMPQFSVIGGRKRRKASSDASGYSMSSSSMFRNKALTTLDEQFDQVNDPSCSDSKMKFDLLILTGRERIRIRRRWR
jgi:protein LTV1